MVLKSHSGHVIALRDKLLHSNCFQVDEPETGFICTVTMISDIIVFESRSFGVKMWPLVGAVSIRFPMINYTKLTLIPQPVCIREFV